MAAQPLYVAPQSLALPPSRLLIYGPAPVWCSERWWPAAKPPSNGFITSTAATNASSKNSAPSVPTFLAFMPQPSSDVCQQVSARLAEIQPVVQSPATALETYARACHHEARHQ